jgi:predicted ester cyclase
MMGVGEADAAPAEDAEAPVDAGASPQADASAPTSAPTTPQKPSERQRAAHVVPGPASDASGPGVPAFVAAVQARDAAAARAALSPAFQGKANGRPMDGDAQVRLLESFWLGFPDGAFAMEPTGGSGRYVITWTFQGTHGGMYLGVPPTGTPIAFSGYIIAVADKGGVTSLDWKWDTKVFTRAVLGPDQVGDLEVKDTFRDPSRRWQHEGRGGGRGPQGKRKKGKGPGRQAQQQGRPGAPGTSGEAGPADATAPGALAQPGQPGQPGPRSPPGEGKRRRRGKGPRPGAPTGEPQSAQSPAEATPAPASSAGSVASAAPAEPSAGEPKPDAPDAT